MCTAGRSRRKSSATRFQPTGEPDPAPKHPQLIFKPRVKAVAMAIMNKTRRPERLVEPAFDVFDRARNEVDLYPDVMPGLEKLAGDFTLVAVTNGNANLERIGIRHLFEDVVAAAEAGCAKPARQIFEQAITRSGYSNEEILHVGDHPETDIDGARQVGMRTAWINRNGAAWPDDLPEPDAVVTAIPELLDLLEPALKDINKTK